MLLYHLPIKRCRLNYIQHVTFCNDLDQQYSALIHYEFHILFEIDILFHPQFCSELARTVASLPPSWGVLHLCPGFAWGRQFQDHEHRPVEFRPERPFKKSLSPRFWNGPPAENAWLGGPIAYIVKSVGFWNPIMAHMRAGMGILDIDLTLNALKFPGRDMVARDPQLCKEIDRGQSVRLNGP